MSYMSDASAFTMAEGIQELNFSEIDEVNGASELGENVLRYASVGGRVGAFVGPKGAAVGIVAGAIVAVAVTIFD